MAILQRKSQLRLPNADYSTLRLTVLPNVAFSSIFQGVRRIAVNLGCLTDLGKPLS